MAAKTFLDLVEIKTKLASLFPFLLGLLFTIYYFQVFNLTNSLIFFVAMLLFDMATTAINNLMDYQKAKAAGYKEEVNIIGQTKLSEKLVIYLILSMLTLASLLGIVLVIRTSLLLLFIGGLCFLIGIFYTFGPVPISRMPLGEVISGLTMGFGIFFIIAFVNVDNSLLLDLSLRLPEFNISGNLWSLLIIFFVSLPTVFLIANIMLANNLCDLEQDISNHRYTLPYYIGRKTGVQLFNLLVYAAYLVIVISVLTGWLHPLLLLVLLTLIPIHKNLATFNQAQIKEKTFIVSIKNLVLFSGAEVILLGISVLIN
ncbi:1,4-dihydroxy-2-naphthoate octaprenyltransferase [Marinilactibacillus piezotolerans]|uniref:1,4-dihydroxy-2-naphthoate octaprenyltransferase n=1 Tax=Marinilactibacillus piezotolerans TaxID=258723 RepID=A0A1I4B5J4_9LACT|nr:1,4-dihydroxy-2-naphthoate polyprenyltransferase [Marinilactibacillus piezotolerans]SFK63813.1 1,4-dihydroxy-2-naphthoate octaprenyltransferase [Marinilactibacillus piezotolerans]